MTPGTSVSGSGPWLPATVSTAARSARRSPPRSPPRKTPERDSPALGVWKPVIDVILPADEQAPRKQRHTARRVWERLRDEHGAGVAESTVRGYVAVFRAERSALAHRVAVPQLHDPGQEAEVDFGDVWLYLDGTLTRCYLFVMRLSASGKSFHRIYATQAQEAFFDGHVEALAAFGGTPRLIRYDNLKPAVHRILAGRSREENERFIVLRSHYGFDSFYCLPGQEGAHEKGGVEGEIGRFRRRHLVPTPVVGTLEEANVRCAAADALDDHRRIGSRATTVGQDFAAEAPHLLPLPAEPFDPARLLECRVDAKARVCVRQSYYSVPARLAGRRLKVRLGAGRVEVMDGAAVVASHERSVRKGEQVLVLDHYLEVLARKPGALPGASALARARSDGSFTEVHERFWAAARRKMGDTPGTRALIEVLLLHRRLPAIAVVAGMEATLAAGSVDPAVVAVEARRAAEGAPSTVVPIGALARYDRPAPALGGYDELLTPGVAS